MSSHPTSNAKTEFSAPTPHNQFSQAPNELSQLLLLNPEDHSGSDPCLQHLRHRFGLRRLIGRSPIFTAVIRNILTIAKTNASVLIIGETGTGKELSARAIHYLSARAEYPFIPVNCGALPVDLVENELFGHERGAFTGAAAHHEGVIRAAEGGTLFLDEIDSLPLMAQVKLLRFLQDKEYRLLGSTKLCQANVRIIAATNGNIEKLLADGALRQDLYYRVNTLQVMLPPLRARPEDIPLLVQHFVAKYATEYKKVITDIAPAVLQLLLQYDWPGNVRELEHVVARAVACATQPSLRPTDIQLLHRSGTPLESFRKAKTRVIAEFEKAYIHKLLLAYNGNITKAARAAGKHRRAFWELMRKHKIPLPPAAAYSEVPVSTEPALHSERSSRE